MNASSYCHPRYKESPYMWMIYRLLAIPLEEVSFRREVDTIKCLAKRNNVVLDIEKIVRGKLITKSLCRFTSLRRGGGPTNKEKMSWIRISKQGNPPLRPICLKPVTLPI